MAHTFTLLLVDNHEDCDARTRQRRLMGFIDAIDEYNAKLLSHGKTLSYRVVKFGDLGNPEIQAQLWAADGIVLSGSGISISRLESDPYLMAAFLPQLEAIRSGRMPVLGVCFGHQLIGYAFGCKVVDCAMRESAIMPVQLCRESDLARQSSVTVEVHHQRELFCDEVFDKQFAVQGSTVACKAQIIKHKDLPVYGVQFHPESLNSRARLDGQAILHSFFDLVVFRSTPIPAAETATASQLEGIPVDDYSRG
ncbi:MAG: gamma-glutamyl-gamma-aminobutyrate hydrolase family protein [Candidatus Lokiarchaeota archaeon]|nr:gamma-glutamyl-gamma-aminobutyrate hydrolase family protein [Candidatus Lokiarchaeota archaeon]